MKNRGLDLLAIIIIVLLGWFFQKNYINEFPSHIHAWAQSDRYALALGFVNNNLNLLKPETFVYEVIDNRPQEQWRTDTEQTITAVDFPVHDYLVAVAMKIIGTNSPWVFRLYTLLYSFLGLFFLFKLALLLTGHHVKSFLVLIFAATAPAFVYYQAGFLPTIPSLSNAYIAFYFYFLFQKTDKPRMLWVSIVFFTLAALNRTTFAIPLIAVMCYEGLKVILKKQQLKTVLLPFSLAVIAILAYYAYNLHLRNEYGSIFLGGLLPAKSFSQAKEILLSVYETWRFQYFSKWHYLLFLVSMLSLLVLIWVNKKDWRFSTMGLLYLSMIMLLGCVLFAGLMLIQYPAHDYYFLDTFFLPVVFLFMWVLGQIRLPSGKVFDYCLSGILVLFGLFTVLNAVEVQESRRETGHWDRTMATIENFKGAEVFLDSCGISKDASIMVLGTYAPNIPYILMNRKGYSVLVPKRSNIEFALGLKYDYIVIQNEFFFSDIYSEYPEIITMFDKRHDNGRISVLIKKEQEEASDIVSFLGLNDKKPVFEAFLDFESAAGENWSGVNSIADQTATGNTIGYLSKEMEFGFTYKIKNLDVLSNPGRILLFQADFLNAEIRDCDLVVSLNSEDSQIMYKSFNVRTLLKKGVDWELVVLVFGLPLVDADSNELAIYLWNHGKTELKLDNFGFRVY